MRDWAKTKTEEQTTRNDCPYESTFNESQLSGNAEAIEGMAAAEEESSFLGSFSAGVTDFPDLLELFGSEDSATGQDETLLDYSGLNEFSGATAAGKVSQVDGSADGIAIEASSASRYEDDVLGDGSRTDRLTGAVDRDGTTRFGARHERTELDGDVGFGVGGNIDSNGVANVAAGARVLDAGVEVQVMADFDQDGSIQAVGLGGEAELGGGKVGASAFMQRQSIERDGTTVRWQSGTALSSSGEYAGIGGGQKTQAGRSESVTFATEAEAEAFEARLAAGKVSADTASVGGDELAGMPEGTKLTRDVATSLQGDATLVAGVHTQHTKASHAEMERQGPSGLVVRTSFERENIAGASIDNGWVGGSGGRGRVQTENAEYVLDLSNEADRAAFDTFQDTGVMPESIQPRNAEDLHGTEGRNDFHMPGSALDQKASVQHGQVTEDGLEYDAVRGQSADTMFTGGRYDIPVAIGSMLDGLAGFMGGDASLQGRMLQNGAQGWQRYGEAGRMAQLLDRGSDNGSESHQMTVHQPKTGTAEERDAGATIRQVQRIAFEDQARNAAALHDEVTHNVDAEDVDVAKLPDHAPTDRVFELETLIDAEGTQKAREGLRGDQGLPFEWGAAKYLKDVRETLAGQSDTLGSFAYALANLTYYGGGDSLEGVRAMAGDEHTEQWLKLEGDDTWIGRKGHRDLQDLLQPGTPVADQEEALADQEARLLRLQDEQTYPEVPAQLRNEEIERTTNYINRLRGAL